MKKINKSILSVGVLLILIVPIFFGCASKFKIDVRANNSNFGTVSGEGMYSKGTDIVITATPNEDYFFSHWSDGDNNPVKTITVSQSATYIAYFEEGDLTYVNGYKIIAKNGVIEETSTHINITPKNRSMFGYWKSSIEDGIFSAYSYVSISKNTINKSITYTAHDTGCGKFFSTSTSLQNYSLTTFEQAKNIPWTDYAYVIFNENLFYKTNLSSTSTDPLKYTYNVYLNYVENADYPTRYMGNIFIYEGIKFVSFETPEFGKFTLELITEHSFNEYTYKYNMTGITN